MNILSPLSLNFLLTSTVSYPYNFFSPLPFHWGGFFTIFYINNLWTPFYGVIFRNICVLSKISPTKNGLETLPTNIKNFDVKLAAHNLKTHDEILNNFCIALET